MILTCPACDTKYVVKDSAIPPEGRKVRCASCKHSWHQDADGAAVTEESGASAPFVSFGGPPEPEADGLETPVSEPSVEAVADQFVAEVPEPVVEAAETAAVWDEPATASSDDYAADAENMAGAGPVPMNASEEERVVEADWTPVADPAALAAGDQDSAATAAVIPAGEWAPVDEDVGYRDLHEDVAPKRPRWLWLVALIVLLAAGAAAFWFYAPMQWKEKAGIAQVGETPLKLMITSNDRQELASGNELLAVSGRVINPTDSEQDVPPIKAELRNKDTKQVVHRWTIAPPARVLAPRSSASFNSAEVDIPSGGDELVVTLGG